MYSGRRSGFEGKEGECIMKMMGLVMIFIGCVAIGYVMDYRYKLRIKQLLALIDAFDYVKSEIDYHLTPLAEVCYKVADKSKYRVGDIFYVFAEQLERRERTNLKEMWEEALESEKSRYVLLDEDYQVIATFGEMTIHLDKNTQVNHIKQMLGKLEEKTKKLEEEKENKSKLHTGMGILVGLCLCLLLI